MKAFPNPMTLDRSGKTVENQVGMDLRDYFASKAMPVILEWHKDIYFKPEQEWVIAQAAYQMADAMMEVRNVKQ